ncbi:MAG: hypothetical protein JO339_04900, partial [Alphaproteobacteria bacterium]|nr:hypothetical protein [Alphaproteobacteria bacterium]
MGLSLSPEQFTRLEQAIARVFEVADFGTVLERYPGRGEPSTFLPANPNGSRLDVASYCLKEVDKEGTLLPFLSRVVEHKWGQETFRWAILGQVRSLARPANDIAPETAPIIAALKGLADFPFNASSGTCVVAKVCQLWQGKALFDGKPADTAFLKDRIGEIIQSLDQFEAIKIVHDSLHVLQVKGAEWLDPGEMNVDATLPLSLLTATVDSVRQAAIEQKPRVPLAIADVCQRCTDTAVDANKRLTSSDADNRDFGLAQLRALLVAEPPHLDQAMFELSRDLPIKQLRALLEAAADCNAQVSEPARSAIDALDRLSDSMRAHILEHALWQATEVHIRAAAQFLSHPGPRFLADFSPEWTAVRRNLLTLVDSPTDGTPAIDAGVNAALVLYERALPTPSVAAPPGPSTEECLRLLVVAFVEFRQKARLDFLAV